MLLASYGKSTIIVNYFIAPADIDNFAATASLSISLSSSLGKLLEKPRLCSLQRWVKQRPLVATSKWDEAKMTSYCEALGSENVDEQL